MDTLCRRQRTGDTPDAHGADSKEDNAAIIGDSTQAMIIEIAAAEKVFVQGGLPLWSARPTL